MYRKYRNGRNYFKILNSSHFEELQFIGNKATKRLVKAELYPEKLFIRELIFDYQERALEIEEDEYNRVYRMHERDFG